MRWSNTRSTKCAAALVASMLWSPAQASAQTPASFAFDSVVSIDAFGGENVSNRPQIIVDLSGAIRVSDSVQVYVRPWFRLPRPNAPGAPAPEWSKELWQAGMRYERPAVGGGLATRLEVGYNVSPVGLGVMDTRSNLNPTIAPHMSYLLPMPAFDPTVPRVSPISSSYPLGIQLTVSAERWDVRTAVLNSTPTRVYAVGRDASPRQTPAVAAGAGVTPITGLRLGLSFAHGTYATAAEVSGPVPTSRRVTIVGGEGEYAFGYTKLSGEFVQSRFERSAGTAVAYEWFVQGAQTLAPRWFVAARHESTLAPPPAPTLVGPRPRFATIEATLGFRVAPDITLRGSYYTRKPYIAPTWDHQAGFSAVWARKWW